MTTISKESMSRALRYVLFTCVTLLAGNIGRAADDYLTAIRAEGDRIEFLGKARQEEEAVRRQAASPSNVPRAAASRKVAAATNVAGFENQLRDQFPGSFALYSLMDARQREVIYTEFRRSESIGSARFLPVITKIIAMAADEGAKDK